MGDQNGQLPLDGVGGRLRRAREAAGMTLAQVAAETRIPQRHLALIEAGSFAALPAKTYATGFARSYAKVVGLDERAISADVRAELGALQHGDRHRTATFEPGDPARIPSRGLALLSLAALILLIVGGTMFYYRVLAPGSGPPSLIEEQRRAAAAPRPGANAVQRGAAAPQASGPVVFTALEEGIWVKFYDGAGRQLMQKQMAKGERYAVPPDASQPKLWTGRPDALAITVGGRAVPRLSDREQIMRDVPVTAAALLGRPAPGTPPTPVSSGT